MMKRFHLLCALSLVMVASCGGPPYGPNDPPPSFAFRYLPPYTGYAQMWSTIYGYRAYDVTHPSYPATAGSKSEFQTTAGFNTWRKVVDGRWPAAWHIGSLAGCGAGTSDDALILEKLFDVVCVPVGRDGTVTLTVNPGTVWEQTLPPTMQASATALAGESMKAYIVDPASETLLWEGQVTFDSSGNISVPSQTVAEGTYYVGTEDGSLGSYAVVNGSASGRWKLDGSGGCYWDAYDSGGDQCSPPPPSGRWKLDGNGGCYWDQWDSGPDQCQGGLMPNANNNGRSARPVWANVAERRLGEGRFSSQKGAPVGRGRPSSGSVGRARPR